ncbi:helix-hairpin-helix domain-containing protein [Veillonella sp. VA142]|uniref:helix-hairpin-helix domain-containing protein n=1 Tax=Veillonella sp. VA142 TaxID=741834 RepID=UPI000F8CAEE5|nr:ComEA family DNA-binding protein [Veillonella sp. VA142]
MKVTNQKRNGIILCLFLLCVCGYYLIIADTPMKGDELPSGTPKIVRQSEKEDRGGPVEKETKANTVLVYVTGAVEEPGLYELQSPVTVKAAIEASKGLLPYADVNHLQLQDTLEESTHIHVDFNFHGSPEELLRKQNISINDGSEAELQKVSGIGPKMAKKIVDYRQEHGPFKTLEELRHVKGIGPALYKKIVEKVRL